MPIISTNLNFSLKIVNIQSNFISHYADLWLDSIITNRYTSKNLNLHKLNAVKLNKNNSTNQLQSINQQYPINIGLIEHKHVQFLHCIRHIFVYHGNMSIYL